MCYDVKAADLKIYDVIYFIGSLYSWKLLVIDIAWLSLCFGYLMPFISLF